MLTLFVLLGMMTMRRNVKVGHDLEEGFKRTVILIPILLLALPSGAIKSLACELMQQILFVGRGMPKMPEESCGMEELVKYAVRGMKREKVIKGTSQGIGDVLSTHKYACEK